MTTIKVSLDTWHKNCVVVSANQGEVNARFLEITLVNGGEPLNLENTAVLIYATKPDGNVIFNNCTIENAEKGIVSVGLTSQMSALSGKLNCEIHVINREQSTLKILGLQIRVMPCANSDNAVESTSEFTVLSDAIEQTREIMDQYSEENIMEKIKSLDGSGSGLDADLLDGKHGSEYATKAQGTKADSAIQGIEGNGTTITPNSNKVVNLTPANIGAVPTTRKVNGKPLSADVTLAPSDVGAAASSHGNHVPTTQTASNSVFLRNDNSWQTVTPANIGAVPTTRKINSKPLSADVTLTPSDIGAANTQHNHSASEITSGVLSIDRGGTNAETASEALENLGGVPKTRTVNNKALSDNISLTAGDVGASASNHSHAFSAITAKPTTLTGYGITDAVPSSRTVNNKALSANISLSASDVGAATTAQGTKADSAIQGVKVNGTLLTPDAGKVVNVDAAGIDAAPVNHASSATTYGASSASNYGHAMASSTSPKAAGTTTVGTETSKFARGDHVHPVQTSVTGNAGTATKLATARTIGTSGAATGTATSFNGSANITIPVTAINPSYLSAAVAIAKGGTGATTASSALSNLGLPYENGTWTPIPGAGSQPCYYTGTIKGGYVRIGRLVYVYAESSDLFITSAANGDAVIKGLPFTISGKKQAGATFTISRILGLLNNESAPTIDTWGGATSLNLRYNNGVSMASWKNTGSSNYTLLKFSGIYETEE